MKSLLKAIPPKVCEKIASGEQALLVCKNAPEAPFKVYMYCTKGKEDLQYFDNLATYKIITKDSCWGQGWSMNFGAVGNGKVIEEFICDKVEEIKFSDFLNADNNLKFCKKNSELYNMIKHFKEKVSLIEQSSCLSENEIKAYANFGDLKALHISALKIYDKPKELGEFRKPAMCEKNNCTGCNRRGECWNDKITHAPQSYMYVETPIGEE